MSYDVEQKIQDQYARMAQAQNEPVPSRDLLPIEVAVNEVCTAVERLEKELSALEQRAGPILVLAEVATKESPPPIPDPTSGVTAKLYAVSHQITLLASYVGGLTRRIGQ